MKTKRFFNRLHTQTGASLIELLISMAIGLVILIALGYFFLGSRQINRTTDDVSRMQESGRNALEIIGKAVRQAGYRSEYNTINSVPLKNASGMVVTALSGVDGASNAPDSITVNYESQQGYLVSGVSAGGETNCTGSAVGAGVNNTVLLTYAFAVTGTALTCNGTVVVDNIEDMQIDYGIYTTTPGVVSSYITAPTAAQLAQIVAVRVSLLVRGPSINTTTNGRQTYTYNGVQVVSADGYLRQVYAATFTVRNQSEGS